MCVRTSTGAYTIVDRQGETITMALASGAVVTGSPPPHRHVTVLLPGHARYVAGPAERAAEAQVVGLSEASQASLAEALVVVRLGGHVVAERDLSVPAAAARCPAVETLVPQHLAAHLWLFHKVTPDDPIDFGADLDLTVLRAVHETRAVAVLHDHTLR